MKLPTLLLILIVISEGYADIFGKWKNQDGSVAIFQDGSEPAFFGTYESAVGNTTGKYKISGQYDHETNLITWSVFWHNGLSDFNGRSCWSGQYFPESETIMTNWLLTSQVMSPRDYWTSTKTGCHTFTRT